MVLDLGLPKLDGLTVLKRWRAEGRRFPVLVLTARGVWTERVEGINAGADDYLPKPFEMEELIARLRALLRRSAGQAGAGAELRAAVPRHAADADIAARRADRAVAARIPAARFPHAPRRARRARRPSLRSISTNSGHDRDPNAIEVIVARLRRKLGSEVIETRRGFGYLVPGRQADDRRLDPLPALVGGGDLDPGRPRRRRRRAALPVRAPCRAARRERADGRPQPADRRDALRRRRRLRSRRRSPIRASRRRCRATTGRSRTSRPARSIRSRSLWDAGARRCPPDDRGDGALHVHEIAGPDGCAADRGRAHDHRRRRTVVSRRGRGDHKTIEGAVSEYIRELAPALVLLAGVLIAAIFVQITVGLAPLEACELPSATSSPGAPQRLDVAAPSEVRPLADEINRLLDAQEKALARARTRATDLAHGLKTPLQVLSADIRALREKGERRACRRDRQERAGDPAARRARTRPRASRPGCLRAQAVPRRGGLGAGHRRRRADARRASG